mmetsp:Transcript_18491/g.36265  ORF Transcript_18491/g.36265 Transcript_18491/m.36265 type:complete len:129 (-) Transcript_18491:16-402(-)
MTRTDTIAWVLHQQHMNLEDHSQTLRELVAQSDIFAIAMQVEHKVPRIGALQEDGRNAITSPARAVVQAIRDPQQLFRKAVQRICWRRDRKYETGYERHPARECAGASCYWWAWQLNGIGVRQAGIAA